MKEEDITNYKERIRIMIAIKVDYTAQLRRPDVVVTKKKQTH